MSNPQAVAVESCSRDSILGSKLGHSPATLTIPSEHVVRWRRCVWALSKRCLRRSLLVMWTYPLARKGAYASASVTGAILDCNLSLLYRLISYTTLANKALPQDVHSALEPRLPHLGYFHDWDFCAKLRAAIP